MHDVLHQRRMNLQGVIMSIARPSPKSLTFAKAIVNSVKAYHALPNGEDMGDKVTKALLRLDGKASRAAVTGILKTALGYAPKDLPASIVKTGNIADDMATVCAVKEWAMVREAQAILIAL
jgi:hypothetical protein